MRLFVVDPHPIFRSGLSASLAVLDAVEDVIDVATPAEAFARDGDLRAADLVVLDCSVDGGLEFIRSVRGFGTASVLVCTADVREPAVRAALTEGASGYVSKEQLTHETLAAALAAVASGSTVVGAGLISGVVSATGDEAGRSHALGQLTDREQAVLTLIADGLPTREVALELSYSERTVKNVLHDVVTKLGVRSRTQAVVEAVRAGII